MDDHTPGTRELSAVRKKKKHMSNIHRMERVASTKWRCVFHIAVPAGNNSAGVAWASVIKNSGQYGTTRLLDGDGSGTDGGIATAEKASITGGTVVEYELVVDTQGLSGAALQTLVNAHYNAAVTEIQAKVLAALGQFGQVV